MRQHSCPDRDQMAAFPQQDEACRPRDYGSRFSVGDCNRTVAKRKREL